MSVQNYLLRNNPEECSSHLLHGRSLKSHVVKVVSNIHWGESWNTFHAKFTLPF